jgi:phosphopantetheinyl transferase
VSSASLSVFCERWPHIELARRLDACDAAVCTASLLGTAEDIENARQVFDSAERDRFESYENREVARRFAIGRLRLRGMLASLLGLAPGAVPIRIGLYGKPALGRSAQGSGVRFSVAHCDDILVVAFTRVGEIGVDVERVRPIERWARVADRVFGAADREELQREIETRGDAAEIFFRFWCRGEAELKATGSGISGLSAYRDGWRPPGLRVAELHELPLPHDVNAVGVRYQAAVALCAPREGSAVHTTVDARNAIAPRITPTSASTA